MLIQDLKEVKYCIKYDIQVVGVRRGRSSNLNFIFTLGEFEDKLDWLHHINSDKRFNYSDVVSISIYIRMLGYRYLDDSCVDYSLTPSVLSCKLLDSFKL